MDPGGTVIWREMARNDLDEMKNSFVDRYYWHRPLSEELLVSMMCEKHSTIASN